MQVREVGRRHQDKIRGKRRDKRGALALTLACTPDMVY